MRASARRISGLARGLGYKFGLLDGGDLPPFMGAVTVGAFGGSISQSEEVGQPPFRITCASFPCDLQEAESYRLPHGRRDSVPINTVSDEIIVGDGQLAVVGTAMVGMLDLDAI